MCVCVCVCEFDRFRSFFFAAATVPARDRPPWRKRAAAPAAGVVCDCGNQKMILAVSSFQKIQDNNSRIIRHGVVANEQPPKRRGVDRDDGRLLLSRQFYGVLRVLHWPPFVIIICGGVGYGRSSR